MTRQFKDKEIEEKIIEIIDEEDIPLSITKIKNLLKERYKIYLSPQIVKRYIFKLKKEGKLTIE